MASSSLSLLILSVVALSLLPDISAQGTCYEPDGRAAEVANANGQKYAPCNTTFNGGKASMCCRIGNGAGSDVCLPSGLCLRNVTSEEIWRESCTDPTWKDPGCLKLYTDGTDINGQNLASTDVMLMECDDGSWCLGNDNLNCCTKNQGYFLNNGSVIPLSTPTASSVPHASGSNISTGAVVGAVVGSVGGALLIMAAIVLFAWRKHRRALALQAERASSQTSSTQQIEYGQAGAGVPPHRMLPELVEERRWELYHTHSHTLHEMPQPVFAELPTVADEKVEA